MFATTENGLKISYFPLWQTNVVKPTNSTSERKSHMARSKSEKLMNPATELEIGEVEAVDTFVLKGDSFITIREGKQTSTMVASIDPFFMSRFFTKTPNADHAMVVVKPPTLKRRFQCTGLKRYDHGRYVVASEVIRELGGEAKVAITPAEFCHFLASQSDDFRFKNRVCFMRDTSGVLQEVYVSYYQHGSLAGLHISANLINCGRWSEGTRLVFPRAKGK